MSPARNRRPGGMDTAANTRGALKASHGRSAERTIKVMLLATFGLVTFALYTQLGDAGVWAAGILWATLLLGRWTLGKW